MVVLDTDTYRGIGRDGKGLTEILKKSGVRIDVPGRAGRTEGCTGSAFQIPQASHGLFQLVRDGFEFVLELASLSAEIISATSHPRGTFICILFQRSVQHRETHNTNQITSTCK